jgi:hypothetical protein
MEIGLKFLFFVCGVIIGIYGLFFTEDSSGCSLFLQEWEWVTFSFFHY